MMIPDDIWREHIYKLIFSNCIYQINNSTKDEYQMILLKPHFDGWDIFYYNLCCNYII